MIRGAKTPGLLLATALTAAVLLCPWATAVASAATFAEGPAATGERLPAAGPWAVVEALWQRIVGTVSAAAPVTTGGGGMGGEVGQGLDPDGGGGDPGDGDDEPLPPPPEDGSTSGGGDGGSL